MKSFLTKITLWILKKADDKIRLEILTEVTKDLFYTISADDILKVNPDGTMQFEGKTLDVSYRKDLRAQAELLENMLLWKVLKRDVEYQLWKKTFYETSIQNDVVWGKLLTFLWDILKTRINQLKK
jgi:hypothetical protein